MTGHDNRSAAVRTGNNEEQPTTPMAMPNRYISTRGGLDAVGFRDTVMTGLAPDGGLLLPECIPDVSGKLDRWRDLSYPELAVEVLGEFIGEDLPRPTLENLVSRSYETFRHADIAPVVPVGDLHVLELFHGPTLAFKDFALQFLGQLFEHILHERGTSLTVLGATSGDTGSAAIAGVRGKDDIEVFIMHPHNRVSPIQARQMTTVTDPNVHNIAIEGTFDDGQRILKELFGDLSFKDQCRLGAVNSVNWARVLAQIVYYFHAAFRVCESTGADAVQAAVPTGNFGDIFAGYLAKRMGAPLRRLVLATNSNDILTRFFSTGRYQLGEVHATLSPSMDIQVASNFERYLYYRFDQNPERLTQVMAEFKRTGSLLVDGGDPAFAAGEADDAGTLETIREVYGKHNYLLDPHTAVGVCVARRFPLPDTPTVCLATAHPAKFEEAICRALGDTRARHPIIDALFDLPTRCTVLPAETDAIRAFIRTTLENRRPPPTSNRS